MDNNQKAGSSTIERSPEPSRDYQNGRSGGYRRRDREGGNEPFEVMLRRFFRDVQQSGILTEIKKRRFREKNLSRKILRESARRKAARKKIKRGY